MDSVQELRVETSLSSAQFDRPGSVILSTKSGTNSVHGSLFETNRNSGMGVARRRQDFFAKPPHYVRNEFGGSVGGPVFVPKIYNGKNRLFWFQSLQQTPIRQPGSPGFHQSWTRKEKDGDFSL